MALVRALLAAVLGIISVISIGLVAVEAAGIGGCGHALCSPDDPRLLLAAGLAAGLVAVLLLKQVQGALLGAGVAALAFGLHAALLAPVPFVDDIRPDSEMIAEAIEDATSLELGELPFPAAGPMPVELDRNGFAVYRVTVEHEVRVQIDIFPGSGDPVLEVFGYDEFGQRVSLAYDDDNGNGYGSRVTMLLQAGEYLVVVSSISTPTEAEPFTLLFTDNPFEPPASQRAALTLGDAELCGEPAGRCRIWSGVNTGGLGPDGENIYTLELDPDQQACLVLDLVAIDGNDAMLEVYDEGLDLLASDDDGGTQPYGSRLTMAVGSDSGLPSTLLVHAGAYEAGTRYSLYASIEPRENGTCLPAAPFIRRESAPE